MKLVIGCGNLLLKDEGVGVHFIQYLQDKGLPKDVELLDGGTAAFDLIDFIQKAEKVIIVDAVKAGGKPGEVYIFSPQDFQTDTFPQTSLHDITLRDVFQTLKLMEASPGIRIIGIEPKEIGVGTELSPELKEKLPELCELVFKELENA